MISAADCTTLHNGVKMPWLGLGVYKAADGREVRNAIAAALDTGYRSIDTAAFYGNERGVGLAVRESSISREDLFITTKLWNDAHGQRPARRAFEESLAALGLEYVDLYLIHWPISGKFTDTWKALEEIYGEGQARAIGVSNFEIHHLETLKKTADVLPMVNQVEFHPRLTQEPLRQYCRQEGIQLEAWSPLTRGDIFSHPVVQATAEKHAKTPAQVLLRWDLEHRVVTIPKSVRRHRIEENAAIFDFQLDAEDMVALDGLNENHRYGPDPNTF